MADEKRSALTNRKTNDIKKNQIVVESNSLNLKNITKNKENKVNTNKDTQITPNVDSKKEKSIKRKKLLSNLLFDTINSNRLKKEIDLTMGKSSELTDKISSINQKIILQQKQSKINKRLKVHHNSEEKMFTIDLTEEPDEYNAEVTGLVQENNDCIRPISHSHSELRPCKKSTTVAVQVTENKVIKKYTTATANKEKVVKKVTVGHIATTNNDVSVFNKSMSVKRTTAENGKRTVKENVASNKRVTNCVLASMIETPDNQSVAMALLQRAKTDVTINSLLESYSDDSELICSENDILLPNKASMNQMLEYSALHMRSIASESPSNTRSIFLTNKDDQIAATLGDNHKESESRVVKSLEFSKYIGKCYDQSVTSTLGAGHRASISQVVDTGVFLKDSALKDNHKTVTTIKNVDADSGSQVLKNINVQLNKDITNSSITETRLYNLTKEQKSLAVPIKQVKIHDSIKAASDKASESKLAKSVPGDQSKVDEQIAVARLEADHKVSGSQLTDSLIDLVEQAKVNLQQEKASILDNDVIDIISKSGRHERSDSQERLNSPCWVTCNQIKMANFGKQTVDSVQESKTENVKKCSFDITLPNSGAGIKAFQNEVAKNLVVSTDQDIANLRKKNFTTVANDIVSKMATIDLTVEMEIIDLISESESQERASSPCTVTNPINTAICENQAVDPVPKAKTENVKLDWCDKTLEVINRALTTIEKIQKLVD